jgi:hypothetical protein
MATGSVVLRVIELLVVTMVAVALLLLVCTQSVKIVWAENIKSWNCWSCRNYRNVMGVMEYGGA